MPSQKATILRAMSTPQLPWLALSRVQLGLLGHIKGGTGMSVFTHTKSNNHLRMQFYQLFIS